MSDHRTTPRAADAQVIQITVVPIVSSDANYVVVYALTSDGSIWRHQQWNAGIWELLPSLPTSVADAKKAE